MTRLRVLYSFPHPLGGPGIGTTALNQVRSLVPHADVTVWCTSVVGERPSGARVVTTMTLAGRRVPHRLLGVTRAWARHDRLVAASADLARSDVVHTWPLAALRTLERARQLGVLGVREAPNTHTAHAFEQARREAAVLGVEQVRGASHTFDAARLAHEEQEYAAAALLLAPSDAVADTFLQRGVPASVLGRHRYGYDPARFFPAPPREGPLRLLFLGRGEPRKGLHYALEAFAAAGVAQRGATLVVRGDVDPSYRRALGPLLEQSGVEVAGFAHDPGAALRDADALVLPSVEEGSALVAYEAMGSGVVPVVSSAVGAPVQDGLDGLVHEPREVAALAAHYRLLVDQPERRAQLQVSAARTAQDLTWEASGQLLLDLYRSRSAA